MRSGDAAGRVIGFKWIHSSPGSVFLRLAFLHFAFLGEPLGTKGLIRLPDFHSRGLDGVHLYNHRLLRRKAEPVDRSPRETSGMRTMPHRASSPRSPAGRLADKQRL